MTLTLMYEFGLSFVAHLSTKNLVDINRFSHSKRSTLGSKPTHECFTRNIPIESRAYHSVPSFFPTSSVVLWFTLYSFTPGTSMEDTVFISSTLALIPFLIQCCLATDHLYAVAQTVGIVGETALLLVVPGCNSSMVMEPVMHMGSHTVRLHVKSLSLTLHS